jgi:ABC-type lipoprotein export system ATPase subunit
MKIRLTDVGKTYRRPDGDVVALDGLSLEAGDGEFVVVHGPSGSGKSTLLLIAGALLAPDRGEVDLGGENPYRLSPEARARFRASRLGFVFQQFHLIPYLTVRENVLTPSLACRLPDAEARADELIARFGLADRARHVPEELSVGERQRAALARALLVRPGLILADEPTGNLDEANGREVLGALGEFANGGGTVLLVTHDPALLARAGRRVALRGGREIRRAAADGGVPDGTSDPIATDRRMKDRQ